MASQPDGSAVEALVRSVRDLLAGHSYLHHARLMSAFDGDSVVPPVDNPVDLAVLDSLPEACAVAAVQADATLTDPVRHLSRSARWTQTSAYVRDPPDDQFLDRYAHATIVGPQDAGNQSVDRGMSVGLLLLGAGVHYPPHHHPADEVYVPLGTASWLDSTDGTYRARAAAMPIHHHPWQPHAIRTSADPLLAIYLWSGDVTTPSRWCGTDSPLGSDRE